MKILKNLQIKLTFLFLTLLVVVVLSGVVSAGLVLPEESYPSAYVVETGYSFTGPASIQDAADNYETLDGYTILLEPGVHEEQVTVNKNLTFTGVGSNPEDTVIESASDGGTIIISSEVSVIMENLVINYATGDAIVNNGQLTLINCYVNNNYYENETMGLLAAGGENNPEDTVTSTETMVITNEEELLVSESLVSESLVSESLVSESLVSESLVSESLVSESLVSDPGDDTDLKMVQTSTESTNATELTAEDPTIEDPKVDPGLPLASLASGMLMVMGGTVISGKKRH